VANFQLMMREHNLMNLFKELALGQREDGQLEFYYGVTVASGKNLNESVC
jgi:hypothetical protein